ncbi:CpsB/CapC family capsule biosynthesis tyrosine phosphatase [Pedobacter sp. P351]|uniref:tyrosine-protein phosphatase n=1 Tax=Pedobacter superstes TaxID=3133441 RepID=UPI00309C07C4
MLSFFKSKPVIPEINFAKLGTDMHSHLIPGIDDGAQNLTQSIELVRSLLSAGFQKIITTPHVMIDYYRNTPETINTGLAILKEELKNQKIDVLIEAAAEYYFDEDFENKIEQGDILTLGNNHLLFEIPFSTYPLNIFDIIEKIIKKGYVPILAHPERYSYLHGSITDYQRLKDAGCYFQLNTISLTGYYGKPVQKAAEELVDNMLIDFLGSDMHHLKHAAALKLALQQPYVYRLLTDYPLLNQTL